MEITIAFYNVENLYDTIDDPGVKDGDFTPEGDLKWTKERYEAKLDRIAEVLFGCGTNGRPPTFIGLSEVEKGVILDDLKRRKGLSDEPFDWIHLNTRDVRGIDVAFMYNRNFFTPEGHAPLNFEELTGEQFGARDILHVWGTLKTVDGERVHFFVNHWPSRNAGERESQYKRLAAAAKLKHEVDRIFEEEPEAHIVIMGDFNDEPGSETLSKVLHAGEDPVTPKQLFNLGWKQKKNGKGTVYYDGDWYLFDSIIVSTSLLTERAPFVKRRELYIYDGADTLFREPRDRDGKPNRTYVGHKYKGGYSDHLAVYCRLALQMPKQ